MTALLVNSIDLIITEEREREKIKAEYRLDQF